MLIIAQKRWLRQAEAKKLLALTARQLEKTLRHTLALTKKKTKFDQTAIKHVPLVLQYISEALSQCHHPPTVQATMHHERLLHPMYKGDISVLYEKLEAMDPYQKKMTGPIVLTLNLSKRRSFGVICLPQDGEDGTSREIVNSSSVRRQSARGSKPTDSARQSITSRASMTIGRRLSSTSGGDGKMDTPQETQVHNMSDAPRSRQPSFVSGQAGENITIPRDGRRQSSAEDQASGSSPEAHNMSGTPENGHPSSMPQAVPVQRQRKSKQSPESCNPYPAEMVHFDSSLDPTVLPPDAIIKLSEERLAKEPLALLHKVLRDPKFKGVATRIRDFSGDKESAILSSMVTADTAIRARVVSGRMKSLLLVAISRLPSLSPVAVRLGSMLNSDDLSRLSCCSRQGYELVKGIMHTQRAAVVAQSSARTLLGKQRLENLKNRWHAAGNIQRFVCLEKMMINFFTFDR